MKLQLRAKWGQPLKVLDENGVEIEGVVEVALRASGGKPVPELCIVIQPYKVVVDAEAEVETRSPIERPQVQAGDSQDSTAA